MHAAKGLEWPIVIPINTMTRIKSVSGPIVERNTGHFYCAVLGVRPTGYAAALAAESAELDRERVRLWYVAATRARELLLLPRLDVAPKGSAWNAILDLSLPNLPAINLSGFAPDVVIAAQEKPTPRREISSPMKQPGLRRGSIVSDGVHRAERRVREQMRSMPKSPRS